LPVVFPAHPRTRKNLHATGRVQVIEPLPYRQFLSLESQAAGVVTDSGGIQEETTVLGVPCFTLRENTERKETLEGTNTLLGLDELRDVPALLHNPVEGKIPEFWDGDAGKRAAVQIENILVEVPA